MADETLELIDWPDKAPIRTTARRRALTFPVRIRGKSHDDITQVQTVRVTGVKLTGNGGKGKSAAFSANAAPLVLRDEGETMAGEMSLNLERNMPPGQYVASLEIGGLAKDVRFDVVEDTSLRIRPSPVVIDTTRARINEASVSFENRGNVPLPIDLRGGYPLGREEPLTADVSETESALSVLTAALNRAPGVLTEVGTASIAMPDGPFTLSPGTSHTCRIAMATDAKLDPVRRYRIFIPVFASELEIAVVTAIKPDSDKPAPAAGGRKKRS